MISTNMILAFICLFISTVLLSAMIGTIVNERRDNKQYWEYVLNNIDSFKYLSTKQDNENKRYLFESELFYLLIGKDRSGIVHVSDYECAATDLYCKKYVKQVKEKLAEKYNIDFGF